MRVEAVAAGIGVRDFWDLTLYEISLAIRGHRHKLKQLNLIIAQNAAPVASGLTSKGVARDMIQSAQQALENYD